MRRKEPNTWFFEIGPEFSHLSEELSGPTVKLARGRYWQPRVDLLEDARQFILKAEIPGVHGEEIKLIWLPSTNAILLRGRRDSDEDEGRTRQVAHQLEILYGEFEREVPLPQVPLDVNAMSAYYRNGLLFVVIPKK